MQQNLRMAKAQKIARPWQRGPRKKQVTLSSFWRVLAQMLSEERQRRDWSTVVVEEKGGPSYGIVQEHEKGSFKSVRALLLHLGAFDMDVVDAFQTAIARDQGQLTLDLEMQTLVRNVQKASPKFRESIVSLAKYGPETAATPESSSVSAAEFAAAERGNQKKPRAERR
jgi:hypothetical protein